MYLLLPFLSLFTFITLSTAFDIPPSAPDGVYGVPISLNGTGLAAPTLLQNITSITGSEESSVPEVEKKSIQARGLPSPQTGCDGYNINTGDNSNAYYAFRNVCDNHWVPPNWLYYVKWGSSVVYMCNYGQWNPCYNWELEEATNLINYHCNVAQAGWVLIQSWKKGYGRANTGVGLCSWRQVP